MVITPLPPLSLITGKCNIKYLLTKVVPIYNIEYINEIKNFGTQIHFTWVVIIAPALLEALYNLLNYTVGLHISLP